MHQADRAIAGEVMSTLSAVFDLATAALATDSLEAATAYRNTGQAQLQVAARLLRHLARSGKIPLQAAAAGVPVVDLAAAAVVVTTGGSS